MNAEFVVRVSAGGGTASVRWDGRAIEGMPGLNLNAPIDSIGDRAAVIEMATRAFQRSLAALLRGVQ